MPVENDGTESKRWTAFGLAIGFLYLIHAYSKQETGLLGDYPAAAAVRFRHVATGSYLAITSDGTLHAVNSTTSARPSEASFRFRVVPVGATAVRRLFDQAQRYDAAQRLRDPTRTRSGCQCSGFSSEHGFGRHCHPWESTHQEPWCYVNDTCSSPSVAHGSFGRRHEVCTPGAPPPSPPLPPLPPSPPPPPPPPQPKAYAAGTTWSAPPGCACSGFANKHGFGAHCAAWEAKLPGGERQTPWCYVSETAECTPPPVSAAGRKPRGRKGSFGRTYLECVPHEPALAEAGAGKAPSRGWFGRRLEAGAPGAGGGGGAHAGAAAALAVPATLAAPAAATSPAHRGYDRTKRRPAAGGKVGKRAKRSTAHEREEASLLRRISRAGKFVTIVSDATQGYLSVELPPHPLALRPNALERTPSMGSVFALLPDGSIAAMGTVALLNLCTTIAEGGDVCTGYRERPREPHYKLLRASAAAHAAGAVASSRFMLEEVKA